MTGVIYARYSSDNQREESIEGQIRENTAFAEKNGIKIIEIYIDRAFSAKTDNRPEFKRMIAESAWKKYDFVIVWKLDRFSRNRYDSAKYKTILKKNNIKVISATETISNGAEGIILESVLEGMAEYYSVDLSEKIERGMLENALKCKYNGSVIPFGYRINEEQKYEAIEEMIPVVQKIFRRYARGDSIKSIIQWLNESGLKTSKECNFSYNSIYSMITNRIYVGEYHFDEVRIPDGVPRMVSDELFEEASKRKEKNRRRPAENKAKIKYILSGKLFCGHCMSLMVGESCNKSNGSIYRYYKCRSAKKNLGCNKKPVKKEWIEDLVVERIMKELLNDKVINRIADEQIRLLNEEDRELPLLRKRLGEVKKRIKNIMDTIESGTATKTITSRLLELEDDESKLSDSIAEKEAKASLITKNDILAVLRKVRLLDITIEENREWLVDYFIKCIILYDDRIIVTTVVSEDDIEISSKSDAETVVNASSDLLNIAPPNKKNAKAFFLFGGMKRTCGA